MPADFCVIERPRFRRDQTATRTIRLSKRMIKLAEQRAKRFKHVSGGTFSGLVELLLFEELGQPEELVLQPDDPS